MERGDIYWVPLHPTLAHEHAGARPVMIISPRAFNDYGAPVIVPITTGGGHARMRGFASPLDGHGLKTTGVARCDQPRTIDIMARRGRFAERAPDAVVEDVLARLATLFD
jgi:mRNA interferase ChpB